MNELGIKKATVNKSGFRRLLKKGEGLWHDVGEISHKNAEILLSDRVVENDLRGLDAIREKIKAQQ